MPTKPPQWLQNRLDLANTLASNKYSQQPATRKEPPLRDNNNRYSIDGVAAAASPPIIWAKVQNKWLAVWIDELSGTRAARRRYTGDLVNLSPDAENDLIRHGSGEHAGLPEVAACLLGLHDGPEHPPHLLIHPGTFPERTRRELGLPDRPYAYQANDLTFTQAAQLITIHPLCLGPGPDQECSM